MRGNNKIYSYKNMVKEKNIFSQKYCLRNNKENFMPNHM
jgi:hypothetical protein